MSDNRITIDETHAPTCTEGEWTLSRDAAFQLLQNPRRRAVLRYILTTDGDPPVPIDEVAEAVAAWECNTSPENLPHDDYHRVYIALYQTHFPTLDEYDIIEYHEERGTLESMPLIHALAPYLEDEFYASTGGLTVTVHDTNETEARDDPMLSGGFADTLIDLFQR